MLRKAHPLFSRLRQSSLSARKRIDAGIVIAGFVIALVFGVLTWFNYQDRMTVANTKISEDSHTAKQQQ